VSNWTLLNKVRLPLGQPWGSTPADGFNGFFSLLINGLKIKVIASDGEGWRHVSVSIDNSEMTPSWSVMCQVKDLFWEPEDWVVQFHPAQSQYVNNHPGVLHLWQCTKEKFPQPDRLMVGYKDDSDIERINQNPESPIQIIKL
jgi:hypothetical protein